MEEQKNFCSMDDMITSMNPTNVHWLHFTLQWLFFNHENISQVPVESYCGNHVIVASVRRVL